MASSLNADNGVVSGSAGLKSTADSSGVLALQTNGTTAVTVNTSQNVGIGTTSPAYKLQVAGTIASSGGNSVAVYGTTNSDTINNTLYMQNSAGDKAANFQIGSSGVLQTWVYAGSSWVNAMTINGTGSIGIGASPSYGTAGQVLTSAGSGAAPTWSTPAAGTAIGLVRAVAINCILP